MRNLISLLPQFLLLRISSNLKISSIQRKRLESLVCTPTRFVSMLMKVRSYAIKHLPAKENLIGKVWKNCAVLLLFLHRYPSLIKLILSTPEFLLESKWMTFLDNLNISNNEDPNMLHIQLLRILLQESISKEKAFKPFWTPAYKALSENLLLPLEIAYAGSGLNLLNSSLKKVEEKLPFLTMKEIKVQNRNSQKTYYQLSTSTVVNKWENEVIEPRSPLKVRQVKLKPSNNQKQILNDWMNTSRYVYNKAVEAVKKGHSSKDFYGLRDLLVTYKTKKKNEQYKILKEQIKNLEEEKKEMDKEKKDTKKLTKKIKELKQEKKDLPISKNSLYKWELKTPKEVRASAIKEVCNAYKTGFANLKAGNIKYFNMGFRKSSNPTQGCIIPSCFISNTEGNIQIAPTYFKEKQVSSIFKMGRKTLKKHKNIEISNDCRIIKRKGEYWLCIPVSYQIEERKKPENYCGIDPGVRTFMSTFGNQGAMEYEHNQKYLMKLDRKKASLKKYSRNIRKAKLNKLEKRKESMINELHWKTITHLLKNNDFLFYGNIKSHGIVKNGKNKRLNTDLNNLKFYQFKERLLYKAEEKNKKVYVINEEYTTKTCSFCGCMNEPGSLKVYQCTTCRKQVGRDINASKNILMKGIQTCL